MWSSVVKPWSSLMINCCMSVCVCCDWKHVLLIPVVVRREAVSTSKSALRRRPDPRGPPAMWAQRPILCEGGMEPTPDRDWIATLNAVINTASQSACWLFLTLSGWERGIPIPRQLNRGSTTRIAVTFKPWLKSLATLDAGCLMQPRWPLTTT